MFKLPTCPYCNTVYRYGDVRKIQYHKGHKCYHCKKDFKISRKGVWLLLLIVTVAAVFINVFQLYATPSLNFFLLMAVDIITVLIGFFLIPFFINFKQIPHNS